MATQGPLYPTITASEAVAPENSDAWVSPGNITSDNGTEASITAATYDSPDISQRLKAQGFGFTIPDGSTIDGITVEIDRRSIVAGSGRDFKVQLLNASGALMGADKADTATTWPTTSTIKAYGGATDTWTASPTPAMVNDPDFGVVLSALALIANADIGVDFIRITVHYTAPPSLTSATMEDADRSYVSDYTDITLNFDRAMELGGANYNVGDTVLGLTFKEDGGAAEALTYRSGEGTATWKVRIPRYIQLVDVITLTYAQASGNIVAVTGGTELWPVTDTTVTNNLTKRIIVILKDKDNAAITTEVAYAVFDANPRDVDDAGWMALQQKGRATPLADGRLNFQYTGAEALGGVVYVAVFWPVEDSSASSVATQSMIWASTIE